jgi:hypothetical protein
MNSVQNRIGAILAQFQVPSLSGEKLCLELGDTLLSASTAFSRQTEAFNSIVGLFEGPATSDLEASVIELARSLKDTRESLAAESGNLSGLLDEGESITRGLQSLRRTLRTMAALASRSRIEAANIARHDHDGHLAALSLDITKLAQSAEANVSACLQDQQTLMANLQLSRRVQLEFNQLHRASLEETERELTQIVQELGLHRSRIVDSSSKLAQDAGQIASLVGTVVFALQIGDSTRQRLEHVRDALNDVSAADAGTPSLPGQVCALGADLIEGTCTQFADAFGRIQEALANLAERSRDIRQLAREATQHNGGDGASVVQGISGQLASALEVLATCLQARAALDEAAAQVPRAIASLQARIEGLNDVGKGISFMGVNAFLKGARVGRDGAGFGVIAHDLRLNALSVVEDINGLVPSLKAVVEHATRASDAMIARDNDEVGALESRTRTALDAFTAAGQGLADAVNGLVRDGTETERELTKITRTRGWDDILSRLTALHAEIASNAQVLAGEISDEELRALFWHRYTMAEERNIHQAFEEAHQTSGEGPSTGQSLTMSPPLAACA